MLGFYSDEEKEIIGILEANGYCGVGNGYGGMVLGLRKKDGDYVG